MIIKLKQEGESYTGDVRECTETKGKFGPQTKFEFQNGDQIYLPVETAARQLLRCGFDDGSNPPRVAYEQVAGNTLTFSRDPNPNGLPYWGIRVADGLEKAAPKPSKRLQPPLLTPTVVPGHDPYAPPPEPDEPASAGQGGATDERRKKDWEAIESAYRWAWDAALRTQMVYAADDLIPTVDSVQAGAATLLIQAERMGAIR